jgi:hypothetical protein
VLRGVTSATLGLELTSALRILSAANSWKQTRQPLGLPLPGGAHDGVRDLLAGSFLTVATNEPIEVPLLVSQVQAVGNLFDPSWGQC